jgi:membrane-bound lytic murein transglycosylase B
MSPSHHFEMPKNASLFAFPRVMMPTILRTSRRCTPLRSTAILFCTLFFAAPADAATCGGDFGAFFSTMSREAAAAGISRTVVDSAFAGLTQDGAVLAFDRRQRGTFRKSFEEYAATASSPPASTAPDS